MRVSGYSIATDMVPNHLRRQEQEEDNFPSFAPGMTRQQPKTYISPPVPTKKNKSKKKMMDDRATSFGYPSEQGSASSEAGNSFRPPGLGFSEESVSSIVDEFINMNNASPKNRKNQTGPCQRNCGEHTMRIPTPTTEHKYGKKLSPAEMSQKCCACHKALMENVPFVIDRSQNRYHEQCFKCISCKNTIEDAQYKHTEEGPVCVDCGLPECHHCENLILGDVVVANAPDGTPLNFHTQCLKCINCHSLITSKYKAGEEGFLCEMCSNPKCTTCWNFIAGGSQYFLNAETEEPICAICHATSATVLTTCKTTSYQPGTVFAANSQNTVSAPRVIVAPAQTQNLGQVLVKPVDISSPSRQVVQTQVLSQPTTPTVVQVPQPMTYSTYTTAAQPKYVLAEGQSYVMGGQGGYDVRMHPRVPQGVSLASGSHVPLFDVQRNRMSYVDTGMIPPGGHIVRETMSGKSKNKGGAHLIGPLSGKPPRGATIVPAHPPMRRR